MVLVLLGCGGETESACDFGARQGAELGAECLLVAGEPLVICQSDEDDPAWEAECEQCALGAFLVSQQGCDTDPPTDTDDTDVE